MCFRVKLHILFCSLFVLHTKIDIILRVFYMKPCLEKLGDLSPCYRSEMKVIKNKIKS